MTEKLNRRLLSPAQIVRVALCMALIICAGLVLFALRFRVAPVPKSYPVDGTLPLWVSVVAAVFCGTGLSVLLALLYANGARLNVVLRPRLGKILSAVALGSLFPVLLFDWMPMVPIVMILLMLFDGYGGWVEWLMYAGFFSLAMYPVAAILISGIHSKQIRFATFVLIWWTLYFGRLLIFGFQSSGL